MDQKSNLLSQYSLVIFDEDGTISPSKQHVDEEMVKLLINLLSKVKVAIISGCNYSQFQTQFLAYLPQNSELLKNLLLLPTSGTQLYVWNMSWQKVYSEDLSENERKNIIQALNQALLETHFIKAETTYGELIEDRISQVTFSALGQDAPLELKKIWDPDRTKRQKIIDVLKTKIPEYDISLGGSTSFDITRKGVNKAYGIEKLEKYLNLSREEILFVGDALYVGGNDYPAISTGVKCISVKDPKETKILINNWLED